LLERHSIYQATQKLGISESAVRQRIHRGTLESGKDENGRLIVYLPADDTNNTNYNGDTTQVKHDDSSTLTSDYIDALKSQIDSLQQDKEALQRNIAHFQEESVRKDHIIMSLTQRIPAIEAPATDADEAADTRDSSVTASEQQSRGEVLEDSPQAKIKQPWWRRIFQ